MKRILALYFLILSFANSAFALAGFADEGENRDMNQALILITLAITQVICYLVIRFAKNRFTWKYKKAIYRLTYLIQQKRWLKWFTSWLLSSFIWSPYLSFLPMLAVFLMWESCKIGVPETTARYMALGSILLLISPSIVFALFIFWKRLRISFLTGKQAIAKLLSVMFQQIIGYFLFIIACATPITELFKRKVNDFDGQVFYIYPTPDGIFYIIENFFYVAFLFAIPYILIAVIRLFRLCINKINRNKKKFHA